MISAIVLTKNEEKNIKECLEGLQWCDEILVIDDYSSDKTVQIARKLGAKVIKHSLDNDFSQQRNFAISQSRGDWIFFVDADERVSKELKDEIQKKVKEEKGIVGYFFPRIDFFLGRWLKHGEIGSIRILRLAKRNSGYWKRRVDEKWEITGIIKTMKNPLLHFSHPSLTEFLESINKRSTLNAEEFYQEKKAVRLWDWIKPLAKFIQNYFLRMGFLDGIQGFIFALLMSFHSFLVRGKLYLLVKTERQINPSLSKKSFKNCDHQVSNLEKGIFLLWSAFVFCSYIYFLFQRGKNKW